MYGLHTKLFDAPVSRELHATVIEQIKEARKEGAAEVEGKRERQRLELSLTSDVWLSDADDDDDEALPVRSGR